MGKYIETLKITYKSQFMYRFDIIANIIITISKIAFAYILWGALFENKEIIAGFTFNSMLSYYILSSFISQLDQSNGAGGQVAAEIRSGSFSKYMVRPMSVFGFFTYMSIGASLFLLMFNLTAVVAWVFIFNINFAITNNIMLILAAISMISLGLFFMMQLNYFLGLLAFKFLSIRFFMMIKRNIIEFIAGSLIPLVLLPHAVLSVMRFFPFYYTVYLPSMLFLGRNTDEISVGIITLIVWNILFLILNKISYKKLRTKYEGVGI